MRRLALLLPVLAGCGGSITPAAFPREFAGAVCEVQSRCRGEARFLEQQCEDDVASLYAPDLAKALAAGKSSFDSGSAQTCLDGLRARGCNRTPPEVDQACERTVTGKVAAGQPCSWIFECVEGRCEPDASCPATCGKVAHEGESCAGTPCDLRLGLRCVGNVCARPGAVGLPCASSADCAAGLFCDAFSSRCAAPLGALVACGGEDQCQPGLFCDGKCRTRFAAGQPCSAASLSSEPFACGDGLLCRGYVEGQARSDTICVAAGEVGASCTAGRDVTGCAGGLVCVNGACADKPISGPCASQEDCKDGVAYCDGAQCRLLAENGAACLSGIQCKSRFCDGGACADAPGACHEP